MAKTTFKNVPTSQIFTDYPANDRMESSYVECSAIKGFNPEKQKPNLYEDIKLHGINVPLGLIELDKEESERLSAICGRPIKFKTLRGHRRMRSVENIRADAGTHLLETVPANVYTGLTREDAAKLMVDEGHIKTRNEYEVFLGIEKLVLNTSMSEENIGAHVGKSRGYAQRRKWILGMPDFVRENFRLRFEKDEKGEGKPHVKFTDDDLNELHKAQGRDEEANRNPESAGSEFMNVWNRLVDTGKAKAPEGKALTRKELLEKATLVKEPIVKGLLNFVAGNSGLSLSDAQDQIMALRSQLEQVQDECDSLRAELKALKAEPVEQIADAS